MTALANQNPEDTNAEEKQRQRDENSRLKVLCISRDVFLDLFQSGFNGLFARCKGMPKDARLDCISEHFRFSRNQIALRIWSSEFPVVPGEHCCGELELEFDQFDFKGAMENIARSAAGLGNEDDVCRIRKVCDSVLGKINDEEPKLEGTWGYKAKDEKSQQLVGSVDIKGEEVKEKCANCGYDHVNTGCSDYKPMLVCAIIPSETRVKRGRIPYKGTPQENIKSGYKYGGML